MPAKKLSAEIVAEYGESEGVDELRVIVPCGFAFSSDKTSKNGIKAVITRETSGQEAWFEKRTGTSGTVLLLCLDRKGTYLKPEQPKVLKIHVSLPPSFKGAVTKGGLAV